jgi:hypothetical protein
VNRRLDGHKAYTGLDGHKAYTGLDGHKAYTGLAAIRHTLGWAAIRHTMGWGVHGDFWLTCQTLRLKCQIWRLKRETGKGEGHFNMEKKVDAPSLPEIGVAIYNESYNYIHHDIYCTTFSDPCLW